MKETNLDRTVLPTDLTVREKMMIKQMKRFAMPEEKIARQIWASREVKCPELDEAIKKYCERMKAAGSPDMDMSKKMPEWLKRTVRR